MKTPDVLEALDRRHPEEHGEWLLLREPFGIDAYAIRCWKGNPPYYRRIAYEVKVSWSDLRNELARPYKRQRAVELSDQFFFAMPVELAVRFINSGQAPKESGLVAVMDDGRTRQMIGAPILPRRELTAQEEITLLRWRHNPGARRDALARAANAEKWNASLTERIGLLRGDLDRAHGRLVDLLGHTVSVGSKWVGTWPARQFPKRPAVPDTEVVVEETTTYGTVRLLALGSGGEYRSEALGTFLVDHRPVAVAAGLR